MHENIFFINFLIAKPLIQIKKYFENNIKSLVKDEGIRRGIK